MEYFNKNTTLYEIVTNYPQTKDVFIAQGFSQVEEQEKLETLGKAISLSTALNFKKLDYDVFVNLLIEAIDGVQENVDVTLDKVSQSEKNHSLNITGLLPCPVRIPILEEFTKFTESYQDIKKINVNYELKAASMGLDWVEKNLKGVTDSDDLPDIFISAGFDMFFDESMMGKFKRTNTFKDLSDFTEFNSSFNGIELRDPKKHYSIISVVPAVFLINKKELKDIPVPQSWNDILSPNFKNRVSLPVGDFDLFNGILLNIYKEYGEDGVKKLGKSLSEAMHPSQMVKSDRKKISPPIVTIMPYFFTKMVKKGGNMEAVWPKEGAIISPIFMLTKGNNSQVLKDFVGFFTSKKIGEILSHQGLFPSVHPEINNNIAQDKKFMWLGWDYIYNNDISKLIEKCKDLFNESVQNHKENTE